MTAEPDLPINDAVPAPTKIEPGNLFMWNWRQMQVYAQACVAHATAPLQAEIEALRVEVGDYRTNGAAAVRFAPNSAYWSNELRRLFGDDARTGIEVLENQYRQELARAERLAEALRPLVMAVEALKFDIFLLATPELQETFDGRNVVSVVQQSTTQPLRNALLAARAALEQENGDA